MTHYLFLSIYTIVILFLTFKIWKKTRDVGFVLGLGFLYYWSLLGSWFIVFDELTNQKGKDFGLAYYHYLEVLFPVHADSTYLLAIHYYALFIIIVQFTILFFIRKIKPKNQHKEIKAVFINHYWIITICLVSVILSLGIVAKQILIAAQFEQSIYYVTRVHHEKFFTIHQLLNGIAISSLYIGFITYACKEKGLYLKGSESKKLFYFYLFAIIFIEGCMLLLGNKREIFFGGILGILFYLKNVNYKFNYKPLSMFVVIMLVPLIFNDGLRSYSPTFLKEIFDLKSLEFKPENQISYTPFTAKNTVFRFLFSNEMFVPHFSMYGIISHDVPLTYGSSLVSLGGSIVPRALWPERPPGIYEYYAKQVNATPGTGYTIHHASAWYLNFGVIGIIIGAFIFGWIWIFLYRMSFDSEKVKKNFLRVFFIIGYSAFCAQIPTLVRNGPEGYKAILIEGIILPVLVIYLTSIIPINLKKK